MKFLIALFCLVTVPALADFNGNWQGTGIAYDNTGWQAACETMNFNISQSENLFTVNSGGYSCGEMKSNWPSIALEIKGEELWSEGKKIGFITANKLHAESIHEEEGMKQVFDVDVSDTELSYFETWQSINGTEVYMTVQGILKK